MKENLLFEVLASQPTTASAFDYLKDPLYRNDLAALLRMYDILPLLGKLILQEIEDRLDNAGLIIQTLKKDLPNISKWLSENSRQVAKRYKEDETQHNCATIVGELHLQNKMLDDLSRKVLPYISKDTRKTWATHPEFYDLMSAGRIKKFVKKYISLLSLMEEMINTEDLISYKKAVIDRCIPMGQLEQGQEFMFPQKEHEMDDGGQMFTYLGLFEEEIPDSPGNKSISCHYRKISDSIHIVYIEQNALRAVLPMSIK